LRQHNAATWNIAEVSQPLFERLRQVCSTLGREWQHIAYSPHLGCLLSAGNPGPCQSSATKYAYEISAPHAITSLGKNPSTGLAVP
jgi:hypothetical protein